MKVTETIQRMPCKECYFISVLVWTRENDSNTQRVDAYLLENDKIISIFKNIRGLRQKAKVTYPCPQPIYSSTGSMRRRGNKVEHNPLPQYHRENCKS